jgi:folate-binding protein YgfZ
MPSHLLPADSVALRAARDAAVACDLTPLALLAIAGPDAAAFLNGQLSSDVTSLAESGCQYTSCNSPKGRMLANFVLWKDGDAEFRALLPADLAGPITRQLSKYVLRSRVTLADVSAATARFGIGGPAAADAVRAAFGKAPAPFAVTRTGRVTVLGLPGPRFVVTAPAAAAVSTREALSRQAIAALFPVWQWLTIRSGVPVVTAPTQDQFVAQMANWDVLGGVSFQKGCYTGQEVIARTQYLGRLKERLFAFHADAATILAGARLYSAVFGDQACGTVINAAPAPEGGCDLLAVVQLAAAEVGDVHLDAPAGPALAARVLPYAIPMPEAPPGRTGPKP